MNLADDWMLIVAIGLFVVSLIVNILLLVKKKKVEEAPPELPPLSRDPQELHYEKKEETPESYPASLLDPDIFKAIKNDIDQKTKRMDEIEKEVAGLKKEYDLLDIQLMKEKELWGRLK